MQLKMTYLPIALFVAIMSSACVAVAAPADASAPAKPSQTLGAQTSPPAANQTQLANNAGSSDVGVAKPADPSTRRICRNSPQTGTRLRALRTCRTEAEWREMATKTQESVRVMQGRGVVPAPN